MSSSHFSNAAERFDSSPISRQLASMAEQLLDKLQLNDTQHWLDFGAGTGVLSVPLAAKVGMVTALDTSSDMLERLQAKQVSNIALLLQDIFTGLPQQFDGVISSMALHHVADIQRLFNCLHQYLKPGAQLALVDLFSEDGSFHRDNAAMGVQHLGFDTDKLQAQLAQAGFSQISCEQIFSIEHKNGRSYPLFVLSGIA